MGCPDNYLGLLVGDDSGQAKGIIQAPLGIQGQA